MKVVRLEANGGPESLSVIELPDLRPVGQQLRIAVAAASLNFRDVQMRRNPSLIDAGYAPPPPYFPGADFSGRVIELGPEVSRFKLGDRVFGVVAQGGQASELLVDENQVAPVPPGVSDEIAATLPVCGWTAFALLHRYTRSGAVALVTSAAGGLGSFFGPLSRTFGVRALGLVSTAEKVAAANGYEKVYCYDDSALESEIRAMTGFGVDLLVDGVGGAGFADRAALVRPHGGAVILGGSEKRPEGDELGRILANYLQPISVHNFNLLFEIIQNRPLIESASTAIFDLISRGELSIPIQSYPLEDVSKAHGDLEHRHIVGKIVLTP